jgi:carboxymethylenebutenolidase
MAKAILNTTHHHREWLNIPSESGGIRAFIVYPDRANKAPSVLLAEAKQGASDWVRAVGDQLAAEGYIAVIPDMLSGLGPLGGDSNSFPSRAAVESAIDGLDARETSRKTATVRQWVAGLPAADGKIASVELFPSSGGARIEVSVAEKHGTFLSRGSEWKETIDFLDKQMGNQPVAGENANAPEDHMAHMLMAQATAPQTAAPSNPQGRGGLPRGYPFNKLPEVPAGIFNAKSTLNHSTLRKEWVDIPIGDVKLHMWVEYPEGNAKAPLVLVMQQAPGLDAWQRAIADQLALQGFLAVAPDLYSGLGPGGGNYDSFEDVDAAMRASARLTHEEQMRRYKAAYAWGMAQPRANGKSASFGFCAGGGMSFEFAGVVPDVNAAVVFYGGAPSDAIMASIKAPVIGFYGENDERVTATALPAAEKMKALGKSFEYHIYPRATHAFIMFQDMGGNAAAVADSWPRAIAFLKQHLK